MSFCTLTVSYFYASSLFDPDPTESSGLAIITRISLKIELFTALNRGPQYISSIRKRVYNILVQYGKESTIY